MGTRSAITIRVGKPVTVRVLLEYRARKLRKRIARLKKDLRRTQGRLRKMKR